MTRQLALDLALPPRLGRSDFLPSPANAAALALVDSWPAWPDRVALLIGPPGAGKSHVGAIWAERSGAALLTAADLAREDWPDRLGPASLLDDADRVGAPEAALFHLLNLVRERERYLLLTAQAAPDHWRVRMPDLLSRLRLAPAVYLEAPSDDLLRAVLVKLFADRQLLVDESVVAFLVLRLARSLGEARAVVEALDRTALARGHRITRPMAAEVLGALDLDEEGT